MDKIRFLISNLILAFLFAVQSSVTFAAEVKKEPALNVISKTETGHLKNTTNRERQTRKNETKSELCQRLAMRIQALKTAVRDNHDKADIKQLISDSTGLNFTTQIYLSFQCDPMQILSPVYDDAYKGDYLVK